MLGGRRLHVGRAEAVVQASDFRDFGKGGGGNGVRQVRFAAASWPSATRRRRSRPPLASRSQRGPSPSRRASRLRPVHACSVWRRFALDRVRGACGWRALLSTCKRAVGEAGPGVEPKAMRSSDLRFEPRTGQRKTTCAIAATSKGDWRRPTRSSRAAHLRRTGGRGRRAGAAADPPARRRADPRERARDRTAAFASRRLVGTPFGGPLP